MLTLVCRAKGRAVSAALLVLSVATVRPPTVRAAEPTTLPTIDFTHGPAAGQWRPAHDIAAARPTAEGLAVDINGPDPFLVGPAVDFPDGVPMRLHCRIKAEQAGSAQLFWFRTGGPTEDRSVRFPVKPGDWQEATANVPPLGAGYRLRFDPPGAGGTVVIGRLWFEPFAPLPAPEWPAVVSPHLTDNSPVIRSGELVLVHHEKHFDAFEVRLGRDPMAVGGAGAKVGYVRGGEVRWVDLPNDADVQAGGGLIVEQVTFRDPDGATWTVARRFVPSPAAPGSIDVNVRVGVDEDRDLVFFPGLCLSAGVASFGTDKTQALSAGLEYLDNEPSSSEADITGPASRRLLPDPVKITFPLMAVAGGPGYVGLVWSGGRGANQAGRPDFTPVFDSPDRTFKSRGNLMGLVFPGWDPDRRIEGALMPARPTALKAGLALNLSATIIAGRGAGVVPAVQHYVKLRGLPPVPPVTGEDGAQAYFALAAAGWLESAVRDGDRYRHAVPGAFPPRPAADAAVLQDWLAGQVKDAALSARLRDAAKAAIAAVDASSYDASGVGHVRYPVASLVYGHVAENADRAAAAGRALLGRFEPDGTLRYKPQPGKPDYGRTHFAPDASGHTATAVAGLLEDAAVAGDPDLVREALRLLRAMDKFRGTVPRGAQTWECPLHIPDVLAAAKLVRAYTLGYELTGDAALLDSARYWAWTGVPFVYLDNPTPGPIGPYASTSVFGATQWVAPVWMGQPVQWTALVYADALYRLRPHDPAGPWQQLADGITASGVQQTYPRGGSQPQYVGLLPDSFLLRPQQRAEPAINPATALVPAVSLYRRPELYTFHNFRQAGVMVHAPGPLGDVKEEAGRVAFTVHGWPAGPYYLLMSGLKGRPRVTIDGKAVDLAEPHQYVEGKGRLVLRLEGQPAVEIRP